MLLTRRLPRPGERHAALWNWRRRRTSGAAALLLGASLAGCTSGGGGTDLSIAAPHGIQVPDGNLAQETTASGFFVNMDGNVLTAAHAVNSCPRLFIIKDGEAAPAHVVAKDTEEDIAVVRSAIQPALPAMLAADAGAMGAQVGESNQLVFAAAYSLLQGSAVRNETSNGLTTGTSDTGVRLSFYSGAEPGASGSAVLSMSGLVLGMIVQRESDGLGSGADSFVLGVPVSQLAGFLRANGIEFQESGVAQLGPGQPAGARANTVSAGIICG